MTKHEKGKQQNEGQLHSSSLCEAVLNDKQNYMIVFTQLMHVRIVKHLGKIHL